MFPDSIFYPLTVAEFGLAVAAYDILATPHPIPFDEQALEQFSVTASVAADAAAYAAKALSRFKRELAVRQI